MAILEASNKWTFTGSTGTGKAFNTRGMSQGLTFYCECSSGCTGTIQIQSRGGSSAGHYATLSTVNMSTGVPVADQFMGPLEWVRPRLTDLTAGSTNIVTVYLLGN